MTQADDAWSAVPVGGMGVGKDDGGCGEGVHLRPTSNGSLCHMQLLRTRPTRMLATHLMCPNVVKRAGPIGWASAAHDLVYLFSAARHPLRPACRPQIQPMVEGHRG